jgi:signal transduction histidine kinase
LLCGGYVLLGSVISFSGWPLDLPRLTDWFNTGVSIQPNAALLMALAGAAIILLHLRYTRVAGAMGAFIALGGTLILLQYVLGVDLGFNHQLLFGREWGQSTTMTRGRVGPPASFSFALIGASLVILAASQRGAVGAAKRRGLVVAFGLMVCAFMLFSLMGYPFGARQFYTVPWLTAIALQTASMLMALGIALVASVPECQPMLLLRQNSMAAILARWVVPILVVLPIIVSWLRTAGHDAGLYDEGTGRALEYIVLIMCAVALMWLALLALQRREDLLRDNARRLRAVLEQLPLGVGVMEMNGAWTLANPLMDRHVPKAMPSTLPDRVQRWRAWDEGGNLLPPKDWPGQRALRGEAVVPGLEMLFRTDEGEERWMRVSTAPLRDEQGQIIGATAIIQDIDEIKRAEQALRDSERQLRELNERLESMVERRTSELLKAQQHMAQQQRLASVGTLAAGLGHDMANLLLPLGARVELLLTSHTSDEVRRELTIITALLDHLRDLSRNLSLFARDPEKDGVQGRTNLAKWCAQVSTLIDASVGRDIVITWDCPDDLPAAAIAPHRLTQAVQNLIHNARDAIVAVRPSAAVASGGVYVGRVLVEARLASHGGSLLLKVMDNGGGMSKEVLDRCLEPFYTTKDRPIAAGALSGGTGLGLSMAYQIIERAGGVMSIESAPGEGTTITIVLPIAMDVISSNSMSDYQTMLKTQPS